ncbi:hypothetical protein EPN83_01925 [Patescibacteria group bacterium]|nr:MAG: hypothetical protein EPN83_01925 [Patescibacteria group bacterium]
MKFIPSADQPVSAELLREIRGKLAAAFERLKGEENRRDYSRPESFVSLVADDEIFEKVQSAAAALCNTTLKYLFVVGIGGANLAVRALVDACSDEGAEPQVVFLDTLGVVSDDELERIVATVATPDEFLVVIASKSGKTIETITNAQRLTSLLEKKFGDVARRLCAITVKNSSLGEHALAHNITLLAVPASLSDRFGAFSPMTLFPAAAAGIDLDSYRAGGLAMLSQCLGSLDETNPAFLSALGINFEYSQGKHILDIFLFSPRLESLGKWYRQLSAESLGRELATGEGMSRLGFTPTVSIGTTDLHSMLQLNLAGPRERFTHFVFPEKLEGEALPDSAALGNLDDVYAGKTSSQIMEAVYESVKESYHKSGLPFAQIILPNISPHSLGEFFVFKMIEVFFLGVLWGVDVFEQPNVEEYKERARKLLG